MNRSLETIFCDDIRQEVGGKVSLIGVYNGVMFVPEFPATLSKFWVIARLVTPVDEPPASVKIRVTKDLEPLVDLDATKDYLRQLANARKPLVPIPDGIQRVLASQAQVCFAPFVVEAPCLLRVTAITDRGEVRGLSLQIQRQSEVTAA